LSRSWVDKIRDLKARRKAVILAHNYQSPEVQDLADFCGDSLGLSLQASQTKADVIVFCGVQFMAETAAILCPDKGVLLPDPHAGCPMADMISADQLRELKVKHPGAIVVCYVNSTAEVKAESDYCCTSANAVDLVRSLPKDREILFVPDQNLGQHTARQTGRDLLLWPGYCRSHVLITEEDIQSAKARYPDAIVMVHPECTEPVRRMADQILSTGQMLKFVRQSPARRYIVGTEIGILHGLKKENPAGRYIPASERAVCPNMKKITLDKILWALEDMQYRVTVPEDIASRARRSLQRMTEVIPSPVKG
jgi:quinolinate synthase